MKKNYAWHFVGDRLRDGRPVPPAGVWLEHEGPLEMCESGLHFSYSAFDTLKYAPGPTLCLVEVGGLVLLGKDKGVCTRRKIIARKDASKALRYFARLQALAVVHLWEAPEVVLDFLMTGDLALRSAAWSAAWSAARSAAWSAARSAAESAAREGWDGMAEEAFSEHLD